MKRVLFFILSILPALGMVSAAKNNKACSIESKESTTQIFQASGGDESPAESKRDILTMIPDPVFLAYCQKKMPEWDTNNDGKLSENEAAEVEFIEIIGHQKRVKLASFTGIEYFTGLTMLHCYNNNLTSLDLSKNTALIDLRCSHNRLSSLNISKNIALKQLSVHTNELTSLDVTNNVALTDLYCFQNKLTSLDVSKNKALKFMDCDNNRLTSLDVTKNVILTELYCSRNQLTSLNVSRNSALREFYCYGNQLTSMDVSNNFLLESLQCHHNPGDGISTFPIKTWLSERYIPEDHFTIESWAWGDRDITPYYYKESLEMR
jgi:hypothetical protein